MSPQPRTYRQLQPEDRVTLASLKQQNYSVRAIASVLGRSASTISRELRRNASADQYSSTAAQQRCQHRRREGRPVRKLHAGFDGHHQPDHMEPPHRNAPQPEAECLYGLIGEVARAGSEGTETNAYAIAANFMAYLSSAVGRGVYLPIGNTRHHARLFCLHIGRSGRGRKGDAVSLVLRLDETLRAMNTAFAPQVHRGGLSTREGLATLIHDGYRQGRNDISAIEDKRLWVVESEFANVLHQGRRDGNTLSTGLRDCWDGVDLKPATKTNRVYASHPHVCLSGAISPSELMGLMSRRDMSNGFANRFLMIWAERTRMLPFPEETMQTVVEDLARRTLEVLAFVRADQHDQRDHLRLELSPSAQWRYAQLYRGELNDELGGGVVASLLERRAPMLLRLAMLMALTDLQYRIDAQHIDAAMAWIRHATATVKYVFVSAADETKLAQVLELAGRVLNFLREHGQATRSQISSACFRGKVPKTMIDACLEHLLASTPPKITVQWGERADGAPGAPLRIYRLAAG